MNFSLEWSAHSNSKKHLLNHNQKVLSLSSPVNFSTLIYQSFPHSLNNCLGLNYMPNNVGTEPRTVNIPQTLLPSQSLQSSIRVYGNTLPTVLNYWVHDDW